MVEPGSAAASALAPSSPILLLKRSRYVSEPLARKYALMQKSEHFAHVALRTDVAYTSNLKPWRSRTASRSNCFPALPMLLTSRLRCVSEPLAATAAASAFAPSAPMPLL